MGLLVRTAEAAGVTAFFAPTGATDPFHPTALHTSMGAALHHPIVREVDSIDVIEAAKRRGVPVFGTAARNGIPVEKWLESAPARFLLVLGNEGAGLEEELAGRLDENITLPMWGRTESLNVAVAAGALLYLARLAGAQGKNKQITGI